VMTDDSSSPCAQLVSIVGPRARRDERAVRMSSFSATHKARATPDTRVSSMHADAAVSGVTEWVTKLCRRLEEPGKVPTLLELADLVGLSPSHVQRTFSREMGVSPHQYGKARRIEGLRSELRSGTDVTSAVYEVGFNSNSVAYAQAKPGLGMTPRRWRDGGRGERIYYTVLASDLGQVLVAATNAGLVAVRIGDEAALVTEVRAEFPLADFRRDDNYSPKNHTPSCRARWDSRTLHQFPSISPRLLFRRACGVRSGSSHRVKPGPTPTWRR